jgi:hypothetical protein
MRKIVGVVLALAVVGAACGKKTEENKDNKPTEKPASRATVSTASTMATSAAASAPAAMAGSAAAGIPDAEFKLGMTLFGGLADVAEKDKGNCDQMADDLNKYVDAKKDDFATMMGKGSIKDGTPDQQAQMQTVMMRAMGAVESCKTNPKMKAFSDRMKHM